MAIDVKAVSSQFQQEVSEKVAEFVEIQTKAAAQAAGRRPKIVRTRSGKSFRYSNTGQLGRNIASKKEGNHYVITDGTRGSYSDGSYHGMYFLVEKRGEREVNKILKDTKKYAENLKL